MTGHNSVGNKHLLVICFTRRWSFRRRFREPEKAPIKYLVCTVDSELLSNLCLNVVKIELILCLYSVFQVHVSILEQLVSPLDCPEFWTLLDLLS